MTVKELISKLSKYPMDTKVSNINHVLENTANEISLVYRDTPEEAKKREQSRIDFLRKHQEEFDRRLHGVGTPAEPLKFEDQIRIR